MRFYADDAMFKGSFQRFYIDIYMYVHLQLQYIDFCHLDDE